MSEKLTYIMNSLDLYLEEGVKPFEALAQAIEDYAVVYGFRPTPLAPDADQEQDAAQVKHGS